MKLDQLTYFVEAARHQHLGRAARKLAISQSAISHSIATLERELGRELFRKEGRHVFLTSHGRLLAERAQKILEDLDRLTGDLVSDRTLMQRLYRLGATAGLASHCVTPAWARLIAHHPRLSVQVLSLRSAETLERVASGELDFGVCLSPQPHPQVEDRKVAETRSLVVVRRGHPLLKKRPEQLAEWLPRFPYTAALELQGISPCGGHPVFRFFSKRPSPSFVYDSYEVAAAQLSRSEAWAIFPEWLYERLGASRLKSLPGAGTSTVAIHALWPKARELGPVGALLVRYLEEELSAK